MSSADNKALEEGSTMKTDEVNLQDAEKEEEAKLKAKYPQAMRPGGSNFLQKRLNRGQKYFDSGDYNMAKAKGAKPPRVAQPMAPPPPVAPQPQQPTTGDTIPTPDIVMSRKTSLVQSKLATGLS